MTKNTTKTTTKTHLCIREERLQTALLHVTACGVSASFADISTTIDPQRVTCKRCARKIAQGARFENEPTTGAAIARKVNAAIKAMGRSERLVAGRGYCYFIEGDAMRWYTSSVPVARISDLSVTCWLAELQCFIDQHERENPTPKQSTQTRWTMAEIAEANAAGGFFFFSKNTLRGFGDTLRSFAVRTGSDGSIWIVRVRRSRKAPAAASSVEARRFDPSTGRIGLAYEFNGVRALPDVLAK